VDILRKNYRDLDFILIGTVLALVAYGCVAIFAATYQKLDPLIPNHAWLKQVFFAVIGLVAMFFAAAYDYRSLRKFQWWIYGSIVVLLTAVFKFPKVNGAHSWIHLPGFNMQPSEFAKVALILVVAGFMASIDEQEFPDYRLHRTWPVILMFVPVFMLTYKEPALGQALVMFAIVALMYMMFVKPTTFGLSTSLVVIGGIFIVAVPLQFPNQATAFVQNVLVGHLHILHGYQADRILTWLDPNYKLLGPGYNIHQSQTAIGSGQLFGEGFLNGIETQSGGVPNQWTDYIFTAIGEEFGFVGSSLLILLFLTLIYRLVKIAGAAQDTFGTYIIIGVIGMFAFQVFENIGMDMYMSPSTGITLPFISYGGSALLVDFVSIGLALSVTLRKKKLRFS
jgi:rod shape determining protein RodA